MEVEFKTTALQKAAGNLRTATKAWGAQVGRLYIRRVLVLYAAPDAQALFTQPALGLHPLKGNRKGEHAIRLTGFYRLIVTFRDQEMTVVRVEEVSKHYDD